jgi:hypothetical protein
MAGRRAGRRHWRRSCLHAGPDGHSSDSRRCHFEGRRGEPCCMTPDLPLHDLPRRDRPTSLNGAAGPELTKFPHRRVLLVAGSHVGNNLFSTPAIGFLKRHLPEVRFDLVTPNKRGASVFANNPHIDRLYRARSRWRMRRLAERYDVAVGFQWDKARDYLSGARIPTIVIDEPRHDTHRADVALEFAQKLVGGAIDQSDRRYVLCPAPADFATISARLAGVRVGEILVGFHLGTGRTALRGWQWFYRNRAKDPRIWPVARYVAVARRLREIDPNVRPVLTDPRLLTRSTRRDQSRRQDDAFRACGVDAAAPRLRHERQRSPSRGVCGRHARRRPIRSDFSRANRHVSAATVSLRDPASSHRRHRLRRGLRRRCSRARFSGYETRAREW